jgi:hypothetical protein
VQRRAPGNARRPRSGTINGVFRCRRIATEEDNMGFGKGALLWLLGIPLPIILLLALFWHH